MLGSCLLITHRPEFQTDWARHPQVTALTLSRLSRGEGTEVVRSAGGEEFPQRSLRASCGVRMACRCLSKS
jgi:hypothetical protein